ncbi:MAG: RNA 2',3'-cyclic phosphodiesterase [Candidatus Sericytochromatia bacterium]|nr:MAG: RNA 2',3'-cyclic phosphodiesterase [Candidatus Sericytochromatia bacterium]
MRTFIAFTLKNESLSKVTKIQELIKHLNVNLVKKDNIHLTLFFFGNIEEEKIKLIIEIIKKIKFQDIELYGTKIIYLPNPKKVSVIALKFETNNFLDEIINEYDKEIYNLGFKRDKKFLPHITIARVKNIIPLFNYKDKIKICINNIKLFKSELTQQGAVYTELFSYK